MAKGAGILFCLLLVVGTANGASPVQKVIELLEDNKAKVVSDLAAEEKEMEEYADFCDSETTQKQYEIKTAEQKIAELTAGIEDGHAQVAEYEDEVAALGTEIAEKEKELAAAASVRAAEKDAFLKNEKELVTSVDELERAVLEIKQSGHGASLVQTRGATRSLPQKVSLKGAVAALGRIIDASWVNSAARRQIQGLVQTASGDGDGEDLRLRGAPEAKAFESSTGGIVETLGDMQAKAEEALSDARNTEMKKKHSASMIEQSLTDGIKAAKDKLADAKSAIESQTESIGEDSAELSEIKKNMKSDKEYVRSLTLDCDEAKDAWDARQKEGKDEIAALVKAKEILAEGVGVFVQVHKGASAGGEDENDGDTAEDRTRQSVMDKLKAMSRQFKSYALMELVSAVAADPFEKVRGLIEEMIAKLLEEANQEATQKAFCDEELSKSKASKAEKSMVLEKLSSRLEVSAAKKAKLEGDVKETEAEIAALDKATAEATKLRTAAKAEYEKSYKDFKDAAAAVGNAMAVLKEYYEGVSLAQTQRQSRVSRKPSFGSKKGDAASSILSILEMCEEDFTKMYMQLQQQETEAEAEYKKLTAESTVSKASKLAEVKGASSEIKSLDIALNTHKEDYDITSQELQTVMDYLEKLKPQCESSVMSYADKKARREAEMGGLKEALGILEGAALLQTKKKPAQHVASHQ